MLNIFDYENYKKFVLDWKKTQNKGQFQKMAKSINVHTSMISKIFKGNNHLTIEQSYDLCAFLGLDELETDYFIALVQLERAGNSRLVAYYRRKLTEIRSMSTKLHRRFKEKIILGENEKARFYSNWYFSGIRLLSSVEGHNKIATIASALGLSEDLVTEAVHFLVSTGLMIEKNGKLQMGPNQVHVDQGSPWVSRHHINWRLKAYERMNSLTPSEVLLTSPMGISATDAARVRELLTKSFHQCVEIAKNSDSEQVSCLNIDWFHLTRPEEGR